MHYVFRKKKSSVKTDTDYDILNLALFLVQINMALFALQVTITPKK